MPPQDRRHRTVAATRAVPDAYDFALTAVVSLILLLPILLGPGAEWLLAR